MKTAKSPSYRRTGDQNLIKKYQDDGELLSGEEWWRDHHQIVESHGYRLRQRFLPGWKPSWIGTNLVPDYCEDGHPTDNPEVIDATRVSDGKFVCLKRLERRQAAHEVEIGQYLSTPERLSDLRNHCVPILDHFRDEREPEFEFIVMPLLLPYDVVDFATVGEMVDFIRQTLEGLVFMHDQGVAHRDCAIQNIMMDAGEMFPNGFHPYAPWLERNGETKAKPLRRNDVSVKYYFIDFGISSLFTDPDKPRLVSGNDGHDHEPPEFTMVSQIRYNPFILDVFILGNVYKKQIVQRNRNMDFLSPLVNKMTAMPQARLTAVEALSEFEAIVASRSSVFLRQASYPVHHSAVEHVFRNAFEFFRQGWTMLRQLTRRSTYCGGKGMGTWTS
ncbi:hypothetical protein BD410DRAFT_748340 [Rickenella mellea]|uniref:Protein kinase domain-containing protein n=1 Tax=Rickenella mellea TaxID=50990 RepID=A0A4Y7Q5W7_9AGAM|nr:hypothetical protein BD410DRAFT_748340 [Rickenella mellea]